MRKEELEPWQQSCLKSQHCHKWLLSIGGVVPNTNVNKIFYKWEKRAREIAHEAEYMFYMKVIQVHVTDPIHGPLNTSKSNPKLEYSLNTTSVAPNPKHTRKKYSKWRSPYYKWKKTYERILFFQIEIVPRNLIWAQHQSVFKNVGAQGATNKSVTDLGQRGREQGAIRQWMKWKERKAKESREKY